MAAWFSKLNNGGFNGSTGLGGNTIPSNGEVIALTRNGKFVGSVKDVGKDVQLTDLNEDWEKFIVEAAGNKFALKQKVSGLYLGGEINDNSAPKLMQHRKDWEEFVFESRGNGFAIKSYKNTYLAQDGNSLKWKSSPQNGSEIWTVTRGGQQQQQGGFNQNNNNSGFNQNNNSGFNQNNSGFNQNNNGAFNQQSNNGLPNYGDTISWGQGGKYVGAVKD